MTDDRINQIECRLRKLEDRSAIAELTARYAFAVNQGWPGKTLNLAALPEIFASDAVWESREMGVRAESLPAILEGAEKGTRATNFAMHSYSNPILEIDRDIAHGRWLMFIASRRHTGPANMIFLEDVISYTRHPDGWRIQTVERRYGMELVDGASSHRNG